MQEKLIRYRDGISVNDRVIKSSNPLLVINGRIKASIVTTTRSACRRLTAVDANHVFPTSHDRMLPY